MRKEVTITYVCEVVKDGPDEEVKDLAIYSLMEELDDTDDINEFKKRVDIKIDVVPNGIHNETA